MKQCAASSFVRIDILINALMADLDLLLFDEPARDLFRTPVLAQATFNDRPCLRRDADGDVVQFARLGFLLCLFGAIAPASSVASKFTRDGRGMNPDFGGNLKLFPVGFHAGINLVSLLRGKLSVTHQCYS